MTVDSLTGSGTEVVANPDGTFTRTDSSMPQRVQQQGKWVPIDTTLVRQTDGTWAPKAAVTHVVFSAGGSGALVTMHDGADTLGFSWPGALPRPVISKDTATYPEVLPGIDLQLTADASGYSSILVVKTPKAAADPRLQGLAWNTTSTNLKLATTSDGGAQATDKHTGKTVFHSDTALMWDSAGQKTGSAARARTATVAAARAEHTAAARVGRHRARVRVTLKHGKQLLGLDKSLLTAKTTTYPVYVDPEWSGRPSQLDWARISDNGWNVYNSTSTSGATNAREGWDNSAPGNGERARTYYQINTSGIKGAVVSHASLYVKQLSAASCSDTPAAVYGTDRPAGWNSSSLYWGHEPGGRTAALGTNPKSHEAGTCPVTDGANSWVSPPSLEFDVTSRAQSAAGGSWSSMTLMVQSPDMNDATQWKQLAYGGGATLSVTYSYRPKLKNGTGTPAIKPSIVSSGKTMTTTHTPTLSARAVDPDLAGGSELVRVDYNVYNSSGTLVGQGFGPNLDSKKRARYNTNGSDWTTPSLPDGTYTWKATAQNAAGYWAGTGSGLWTKTQTFTVDTSAPPSPTVTSSQFPAKQIGAAFGDQGTFVLGNNHTNNITGYLFSLDATLGSTVYSSSGVIHLTPGAKITQGQIYYATSDNGHGTGTSAINGSASPVFAPGVVGPHTLYAKAVDQAGSTSISQTAYAFYAGTSAPTYAYGDKMISGWTATNTDGTTTAVPKATTTSTGGQLISQAAFSGYEFADGYQAMLSNKSTTSKVVSGDSATFSFDIPKDGPWSFGANLTKAKDYGIYHLILDAGKSTQSTLISGFDAYNSYTTTQFLNLGIPKDANGQLLTLNQGVHTLTLTVSGKNPGSTGYQAGIDVLRLGPALACAVNATSSCLNNTATSTFTTTTSTADADGSGNSINSADLTSTAGWQSNKTVTVDGATVALPKFGTGTYDNMLASGQTITLPGSGVVNTGDAVVFLAFATGGAARGATGTITYAKNNCVDQNNAVDQAYRLDTVPDWLSGPASAASITLVHENHSNNTQTSPSSGPKVYAVSVPLECPGSVISSVSLPLFTNGVQAGQPTLHVLGLGVRPMTVTGSGSSAKHWVGTWSSVQDTAKVQLSSGSTASVNGQTLRIPAHVSIGTDDDGRGVRIHLSNAMGTTPVTFDAASVALQDTTAGGATAAVTPTTVTFGGSGAITIPAGADATSDSVSLPVAQQTTLLVSLQVHGSVSAMPGHAVAQTPVWTSDAANRTGDTTAGNYTQTTYTGLPYLAGIDVTTPNSAPTGSLVLYGDQTINGDTASGDGQHHLSDAITNALVGDTNGDNSVDYGILNAGTNSTSLSNNLLPQITNSTTPESALNPLDRNVLTQGNVRTVLLSTGAADLLNCTGSADTCATNVENGLAALNSQVTWYNTDDSQTMVNGQYITQNANITAYFATIPPFTAAHPGTATQEAAREQVNDFLLNNFPSQVIDFAAAVSTDGTAQSSSVKAADLTNGNPSNAYYADLASRYVSDTNTVVSIAPNLIVPLATGSDTPEDDWELATDGTDSNGDNPSTAVGGTTFSTDGPDAVNAGAGAASFDGSTGFLESDHTAVDTSGDYTISAWVKINSNVGATAICQGTSQHQAFYIGYDSGNKGWMFQTTTTNDAGAAFPTAEGDSNTGAVGTWAHLLVTYTAPVDGDSNTGVMSIYQNGTLMGTASNLTPQYDSAMPLTIGGCVNSPDATTPYAAFPGSVADVHTYPYAMQASQASAGSVIVPMGWGNGMPEDEWKLAANGNDTAALNLFTASGSAAFGTDAPSGATGSVAFDGNTGFLKSKQSAVNTLGDYTVSTWVKINSALGTTAVCQGTTQHQAFYLSYDKASKAWMFQTTTTNDENSDFPTAEGDANTAPVGTWTHLVAAYRAPVAGNSSSGSMALYQNGTLMGTATNLSPQYDSSMPLTIGGCVNSASATSPYLAFPGSVADVHVFPRTLSATEVGALH
ncbi:LamG-like jellyroll fold domain-containing protein [Streptomyces sp. NPDC005784]|uniref:LamG-like jellyroll fold domain-containing protein n=1 Tax=Streptomyces sp. NPDC005784 TaxID=3364731 RepID=UPI0036CA1F60